MKKLVLILMVLIYSVGYSQEWIDLDLPELTGVSYGETVIIPVTATDVIVPNLISTFYIYVEWEDAVLDYVSMALSPEMIANMGMWNILFSSGNASGPGSLETCVGGFINTVTGESFSINPGDVFFNITCTYVGDGSEVYGVGATDLNFQFGKNGGESGKLTKGNTLVLNENGESYILNYDVPSGSVNLPSGPTPTDWTGLAGDVWNDDGNWTNFVPTGIPEQSVTIDAATKAAPVIYGSAVAGTLNLIAGQLTIAPGGDLTTTGLFTNAGHLQMSNFLGVSASFWPQAGLAGGGTFQYDRDVFCSGQAWNSTDPFGWHYISSPISGFTTDDIPDYFVNAWNEGATGVDPDFPWMHYGYDPYVNPCVAWPNTPMNPLDAWSVNFDPAYPYNCTGLAPGTGNVVEFGGLFTALNDNPAGYSAPATAAGGHAYAGWNFYGNPYAASLDPALFNWTGFDNGTYGVAMWSEDCSVSNYIYSGLGNGYANYVGPTQGFFMLTTGATTFALTGGERAHTSAPSIYKDEVTNLLTLEAAGDGTSDVTYIRFMEEMEAGNDVADFPKLFSAAEGLAQIYTTALGEKLAINALPETSIVPMGFTSVTSGEYTISAIETSDFTDVVLEDLVTGEQTDLLINSYSFNYTVNDDADRFLVHFTPLGIGDNLANSIDIWSNDHKIYVQAPEINGDIVVFNMMGQEVIRTEIEPGLNIIPVNDRNSYYVVKVVSSDVARTGKVYVK